MEGSFSPRCDNPGHELRQGNRQIPRFVVVDDPDDADLPIRWVDALEKDRQGETRRGSARSAEIAVRTIEIASRWDPRVDAPLEHLVVVVRHEVGHALGLVGHSPEPTDLMGAELSKAGREPSESDRETLRLLYSYAPGEIVSRFGMP